MMVYVATHNPGKFRELRAIFAPAGWTLAAYEGYQDAAEGDRSYAENAALKARALFTQMAHSEPTSVLGDDSGLEVAALGGRPGIRSARYGGKSMTWAERRAQLLGELGSRKRVERSARFVCALHFIARDGTETAAAATYDGWIAHEERGHAGFSYDSIFVGDDGRTFAELSEREKNRISHRRLAADALLAALGNRACG
ncbi:MAG: non-canonical purine NTP pyrophosphatase [Candidatus Eremiobacteraeota bacterium]|nr:non-canonical purine NTP pyrophosphatase [Candidatus Eremiobacteraeota bacterium]MBC5802254.1 non-canonical purine NTP pyrophosphatase [Candidatus Eremiobacteraeota bacterium]MBC5822767.1 non-canonical purine NTP pyrophosphatase [Candidatus Eremiobacteraeota bacterium]